MTDSLQDMTEIGTFAEQNPVNTEEQMKSTFLYADSVYDVMKTGKCTHDDLYRMLNDEHVAQMCRGIEVAAQDPEKEDYVKSEKTKLPVIIMGAQDLKGDRRRCNENVVPSGKYVFDLDHLENPANVHRFTPEEVYGTFLENKEEENGIFWVFKSPSGRGLKWAYDLLPGENIEESQQRMAQLLPEELRQEPFFDKQTDPSRCTFMVPMNNVLFLDEDLMFSDGETIDPEVRYEDIANEPVVLPEVGQMKDFPKSYTYNDKGIPIQDVICDYWRNHGGEPKWNEPNGRNSKIFDLVRILAPLCEFKQEWLEQLIPDYGLSGKEIRTVIAQGIKYAYMGFTKELTESLERLSRLQAQPEETEGNTALWEQILKELADEGWPIGIKESLTETSEHDLMPTLCATLTAMTPFLDGMKFKNANGRNERPILQTVVIGPKASGKSVCTGAAFEWWSLLNKEEEKAWENIQKWQDNDEVPRPKDIIRAIPADFTKAAIRDASINAHGATMLIVDDEMGSLIDSADYRSILPILRKAFDGQYDGAKRAGRQGVSGITKTHLSFMLNGTPDQGLTLLGGRNLTNGNTDRILPCLMERRKSTEIPYYPQRSEEDRQRIREAGEILRQVKGTIEIPRINDEARQWYARRVQQAWDNKDEEMEDVLTRIIPIATRATIPYLVLTGGVETDNVVKFMRMMLDYALQMRYSIQKGWFENQQRAQMPKKKNIESKAAKMSQTEILEKLPQTFTYADIATFFTGSTNSRDKMISRWKTDDKIRKVSSGRWEKI